MDDQSVFSTMTTKICLIFDAVGGGCGVDDPEVTIASTSSLTVGTCTVRPFNASTFEEDKSAPVAPLNQVTVYDPSVIPCNVTVALDMGVGVLWSLTIAAHVPVLFWTRNTAKFTFFLPRISSLGSLAVACAVEL